MIITEYEHWLVVRHCRRRRIYRDTLVATANRNPLDSKHGHELVYMLRVLLWDTLGASVDISTCTCTPYCSTVCLCLNNSLTHSHSALLRSFLHSWSSGLTTHLEVQGKVNT